MLKALNRLNLSIKLLKIRPPNGGKVIPLCLWFSGMVSPLMLLCKPHDYIKVLNEKKKDWDLNRRFACIEIQNTALQQLVKIHTN